MKVQHVSLHEMDWRNKINELSIDASLILLFVSPQFDLKQEVLNQIKSKYPKSIIIGCSTAGEISGVTVKDASISLTAIQFQKITLKKVSVSVKDMNCSIRAGEDIASQLNSKDLKHVLVLSDGLHVNGADLVTGLKSGLPNVSITGGLAADGPNFNNTFIINDDNLVDKTIVGLGFYGDG